MTEVRNIPRGSIVVGADGSEHADRAVRWAAEQAGLEHRPLVVAVAREQADPDRVAEEAVALADATAPGTETHVVVADGDPRGLLVDLARDAHLLVVGSRGRGTFRSMLLGSVSAALTRHAPCPVVVCRPPVDERPRHGVLVALDGTSDALDVLDFAFAQASMRQQELVAVHCTWDVVAAVAGLRELEADDLDRGAVEELRLLLGESVAGYREKYPDVPVTLRVTHGLVDEVLALGSHDAELVVVGRHPLDHPGRFVVGSIATAVVERARSAVAVVPERRTAD